MVGDARSDRIRNGGARSAGRATTTTAFGVLGVGKKPVDACVVNNDSQQIRFTGMGMGRQDRIRRYLSGG